MKNVITKLLTFIILIALIASTSCTKEAQQLTPNDVSRAKQTLVVDSDDATLEAALNACQRNGIKAEGTMNYQAVGFIPLSFDAMGNPTSARLSMEGAGKIHPFGKVTVASSFTFDFIRGVGSDFATTYTDKHGNKIHLGGTSVLIGAPNGIPEYIITEHITGGTGRYEDLKGGGESHVYQTQSTPSISGYYDVKWRISMGRGRDAH